MMAKEYARVEIMGFRVHYGRISEVERFGAKMLRVDEFIARPTPESHADDDIFQTFFYGASAIFCVQPMTEEAVMATVTKNQLPAPKPRLESRYIDGDLAAEDLFEGIDE